MLRDNFLQLMNLTLYEPSEADTEESVQYHRDAQLAKLDELIALDLSKQGNDDHFTTGLSSLLEATPLPDDRERLEGSIGETVSLLDVQRAAVLQRMELGFQTALAKKDERLHDAVAELSDWSFGEESTSAVAIFGAVPEKYSSLEQPIPGRKMSFFQGLQKMQRHYAAEVERQSVLSSSPSSMVSSDEDSTARSSVTISDDESFLPSHELSNTSGGDESFLWQLLSGASYEKAIRLYNIRDVLDPQTPASTRLNYLEEAHHLMEDILLEINELPDEDKQRVNHELMPLWDNIQQRAAPFEFVKEQAMRFNDLSAHFSQDHEALLERVKDIHAAIVATMAPYKDDPSFSHLAEKYVRWADARLSEMQSLLALAEAAMLLEECAVSSLPYIDINDTDALYANRVYAAVLLLQQGTALESVPIKSSVKGCHGPGPSTKDMGFFHRDPAMEKQHFIKQYLLNDIKDIGRDWVQTAMAEGLSGLTDKLGFDGDATTFYQEQVARVTSPSSDMGHREDDVPPSPSRHRS